MLIHTMFSKLEVRRMNLTGFGEAEAVDTFREVVHTDVLGFTAILEKLLRRKTGSVRMWTCHTKHISRGYCDRVTDY